VGRQVVHPEIDEEQLRSTPTDLRDDRFGGLLPDDGFRILVPVLGPDADLVFEVRLS